LNCVYLFYEDKASGGCHGFSMNCAGEIDIVKAELQVGATLTYYETSFNIEGRFEVLLVA